MKRVVNAAGHKSVHRLSCFLPSKLLRVLKKNIWAAAGSLLFMYVYDCPFCTCRCRSGRNSGRHHGLCEAWWAAGIRFGKGVEFYSVCHLVQASLVIRDLTLRVFAITRFREKKTVRKLYSNFAVTVYGGGVTVWRAHQLVTSYQYQCEREC